MCTDTFLHFLVALKPIPNSMDLRKPNKNFGQRRDAERGLEIVDFYGGYKCNSARRSMM